MPLLVKAPQQKKQKTVMQPSILVSFKPEDEVEMIVQTQTVTGRIPEEQTESDDEISDNELADPSSIPEQTSNQPRRTNQPTNQRSAY